MIEFLALMAIYAVLYFVLSRLTDWAYAKWPCACGRSRLLYFGRAHPLGGLMLGQALFLTAFCTLGVLSDVGDPLDFGLVVSVVFGVGVTVWVWRRWWFHEKDKIKRRAAKAAGRVVVNEHGRLAVERVRA